RGRLHSSLRWPGHPEPTSNMTTWVNSQFPRPDFHRQVQRHYGLQTQILTLSDPKIRGQEPKTLSKRAHNPLWKEAGLTKPTAAHPSGGPVQYCSARDLRKGVWHDICAMSSCVPVKLPG